MPLIRLDILNVRDLLRDLLLQNGFTGGDTGGGMGGGDIWVSRDGVEYFIQVRLSGNNPLIGERDHTERDNDDSRIN